MFWKNFCEDDYILKNSLVPIRISSKVTQYFVDYVGAVLHSKANAESNRYLSKNNNNILRTRTLTKAFPNAILVIPFRSPLQHANSLLRQHERFTKSNKNNSFELKYMNWLGHHEFGENHKPFSFNDKVEVNSNESSLEYWLEVWLETYRYLLDTAPKQAIFISYERLCDSEKLWRCLENYAEVGIDIESHAVFQLSSSAVEFDTNSMLYHRVNDVHLELLERCDKFVLNSAT